MTEQLELPGTVKEDKQTGPKLEKPPCLRVVCSISCSMAARDFFSLLKQAGVSLVMDTRRTRSYQGRGFATEEEDFRYLCELHGMVYIVTEQLMPPKELREQFGEKFKYVKAAANRDPQAWTNFLLGYQQYLHEQRPLRQGVVHEVLYGSHEKVAVVCACPHHEDCHRLFATSMMVKYLPGVELKVLYMKESKRSSPRRYRLQDFPYFDIKADKGGK